MKNIGIFLILFLLAGPFISAQRPGRYTYYRVDRVITVKGEILEITKEECYRSKNFTIIYLEEKKNGPVYLVEVSPDWFYNLELMKGSSIEVTGSYTKLQGKNLVIARSITYRGEHFQFRDKYGFPLWQGKGRQKREGERGRKKRKGNR